MATEHKNFGEFFKHCRLRANKGLREFCVENGLDPGNISKIEHGMLPPPQSHEKLAEYANALELREGSDDWYELFDRAAADKGIIPKDLLNDEELLARLPLVFRTMRNKRPDMNTLDRLIEFLRKA